MNTEIIKDPQAVLDYEWDWTAWLVAGETITTGTTVTVPTGLTLNSFSFTSTKVTAWLSGGTAGTDYAVLCHIVTNQGRTDERTILIVCRNR